jgi:hypothetical protein
LIIPCWDSEPDGDLKRVPADGRFQVIIADPPWVSSGLNAPVVSADHRTST